MLVCFVVMCLCMCGVLYIVFSYALFSYVLISSSLCLYVTQQNVPV